MPGAISRLRRWLGGGRAPARTRVWRDEEGWVVDVRGQTCPGYLLQIDRVVRDIGPGQRVELRISYPPCIDDVRVWCAERGHVLRGVETTERGCFSIRVITGVER